MKTKIKNEFSFDGIRFNSSLRKNGKNIVLFNTHFNSDEQKDYFIENSSIYFVNNVEIAADMVLPSNYVHDNIIDKVVGSI